MPATLRLELLGGFRVTVDDHAVPDEAWRRRKAAGLVKLLALAPGRRLHREQVIDVLKAMRERTRFVRGLRSWSGFRQVGVAYERSLRHAGASILQCVSFGIFSSGHWG